MRITHNSSILLLIFVYLSLSVAGFLLLETCLLNDLLFHTMSWYLLISLKNFATGANTHYPIQHGSDVEVIEKTPHFRVLKFYTTKTRIPTLWKFYSCKLSGQKNKQQVIRPGLMGLAEPRALGNNERSSWCGSLKGATSTRGTNRKLRYIYHQNFALGSRMALPLLKMDAF